MRSGDSKRWALPSKDEKEGAFFGVGDTTLSFYAKTEYFSR